MKKRGLNIIIGIAILGIGMISFLPPPDLDFLIILGLTIVGIPLKYSIPITYVGSLFLILIGCWMVGKNMLVVLKLKKSNKKRIQKKH